MIDQHLERYLGPIARGWAFAGEPSGVRICLFENRPHPGAATYATLGLSRHVLAMPRERQVRQELLLAVGDPFASDDLASPLVYVAGRVVREHRALLRGDVVSVGNPVSTTSTCKHLYSSSPVVFPRGLAGCDGTQPTTVFVWLVPILDDEAALVRQHGWSHFERLLELVDPDLLDLERRSITTATTARSPST